MKINVKIDVKEIKDTFDKALRSEFNSMPKIINNEQGKAIVNRCINTVMVTQGTKIFKENIKIAVDLEAKDES